jgi:signal peptidase II
MLITVIFFLDQLAKFFVLRGLSLHQSVNVIPGVLYLTLVHNRGAAFGILQGAVSLCIVVSAAAIFFIYLRLKKGAQGISGLYRFSLSLVFAGALGNLVDRIRYGYVVDFIDLRVWPVFNVADCAITVGAILLGIAVLKTRDT